MEPGRAHFDLRNTKTVAALGKKSYRYTSACYIGLKAASSLHGLLYEEASECCLEIVTVALNCTFVVNVTSE